MSKFTSNDMLKEVRANARKNGLTFKIQQGVKLNGSPVYKFINKASGATILSNCTLDSAYGNVMSGYIDTWDGNQFNGLGCY